MSGLKKFYMKNIKIFTIILVLIALFVAYKCYTKYSSAQKAKKMASSSSSSSSSLSPSSLGENYRYGSELSEIVQLQLLEGNPNLGGSEDSAITRLRPDVYGTFSEDPLADIIYKDIQNLGESGHISQLPSTVKDVFTKTAYGGEDLSKL